jgi:putative nucleotidyltransferase with HDIG domain
MIVVLDTLVISFWLRRRSRRPSLQVAFNVAAPSVAIWLASHCFYWVTGIQPLLESREPELTLVVPLLGLATLYFLLNSWLIAFAVAFQNAKSALWIWKQSFLWLSLNFYSGASVAALLLPYVQQTSGNALWYIAGVLLPVLLISYLTFKTALGRVEDANKHLSELNRLYISTIETLAMAIDAKDQITHGHIRRVQQYAVSLARHIGVNDNSQISAIEAASLLHDMGKLAVPEYILNKPGKLTPAEFEKMKLHASVGADILSAIDFPYPVVPIVRHHHENWDGSGYPKGLRGTTIPIGARILSVVDCFDALTSDRPYRPRLSDTEAIQILCERRGTMYDPLVVDAFLEVYPELSRQSSEMSDPGLSAISKGTGLSDLECLPRSLDDITNGTDEMLVLYELAKGLPSNIDLSDVGDLIAKHLRRLVPTSLCVFYVHDPHADDLIAAHAVGDHAWSVRGMRIHRGERLSGWVAANRRSILNSDPVLDFGDLAQTLKPRLLSCLSAPMLLGGQVVGVLSLYSAHPEAFSEDHRRVLDVVAKHVAQSVKRAVDFEAHRAANMRDPVTSLPNLLHLERLIEPELAGTSSPGHSLVLVTLRGGDLLFRNDPDEFVALLTTIDDEGTLVAEKVSDRMRELLAGILPRWARTSVSISTATAPSDGTSIRDLLMTARRRSQPPVAGNAPAVH